MTKGHHNRVTPIDSYIGSFTRTTLDLRVKRSNPSGIIYEREQRHKTEEELIQKKRHKQKKYHPHELE